MLYISGVILSFFLSAVLITKKNKKSADYILLIWLCIVGINLITVYLFLTGQYVTYPNVVAFGRSLPLLQGPFLYLYTRSQTTLLPFRKKDLLHFLPLLASLLLFSDFYQLSFEQKIEIFKQHGAPYRLQTRINTLGICISGTTYVIFSISRLIKYRKALPNEFSNTEKIKFNWLFYLIIWMVGIWLIVLFTHNDRLIFGAASLFVLWLGFFGIRQENVFKSSVTETVFLEEENDGPHQINTQGEEKQNDTLRIKYQKSNLNEADVTQIHEKLRLFMDEQKPYTNPDLTLSELAKSIGVHPNQLSQVINSKENKNFYELINERRVQEFIKLASVSENEQFTLLALAFDCGFNSKASFNRNFKRITGLTPSEYLNKQKNNS